MRLSTPARGLGDEMKIEMLDDEGQTEICKVHECYGNDCESAAQCEDCGAVASSERPVYVWKSKKSGMDYWACSGCLLNDPFARLLIEEDCRSASCQGPWYRDHNKEECR